MGAQEKQPRRNIFNKAVTIAKVPIAAAILSGCSIATDVGIPKCDEAPQSITRTVTLFPDSNPLSVEGNIVTAEKTAGEIDIKPRQLISPSKLEHTDDGQWRFQGVGINGQRQPRNYSITAKPDTNPDNIGRNGTAVTIQADCKTKP